MNDINKTKEQLLNELEELRQRIAKLEISENKCKLAEEALKESEKNYKFLIKFNKEILKNIPIGIIRLDSEMRIQYENPELERIIGLPKDIASSRAIGTDIRKLPGILNIGLKVILDELQKGNNIFVDFPFTSIYGKKTYLRAIGCPIHEKGQNVGSLLLLEDISERKQAEKILKESEEKYKTLTENINVGIYRNSVGPKGKFIEANPAIIKIFGYESKDEFLSTNVSDLYQNSDNRKKFNEKILRFGFVKNEEEQLRKKDGTLFLASISAVAVKDENGEVKYYDGIIEDITKRKKVEEALRESEERYRTMIENANDMIWTLDTQGNFTFINQQAEMISGQKIEDVIGKPYQPVIHPDDIEMVNSIFLKTLSGNPQHYIVRIFKPTSEILFFSVNTAPIYEKGKIVGTVSFGRDITERKRAEDALEYRFKFERLITALSTNFINLSTYEIDEGINNTLQIIGKFAKVDRSYVFLFFDNAKKMNNTHEWCAEGIEPQIENNQDLLVSDFPWCDKKIKRFETIHIPSVANLPPEAIEKEFFQSQKIQSLIIVPMVYGRSLYGFIGFDSVRKKKEWTEDTIAMLRIVTEIFMNALERKRTERAFQESEKQYRTLVEAIQEGMCVVDKNENIIFANPSFSNIFGYSHDEIIKMNLRDFVSSEGEFKKILQETEKKKKGITSQYDLILKRKDGELRNIKVSTTPWLNDKGEFQGTIGMLMDITERMRSEKELKLSFKKLQRTLEGTVNALASTVDKRDPYTAGHQKRVTKLACVIAREMGLSKEQIDCIRIAGILHDIGKVHIAAEILNKPIKLSDIEMVLVRTHVQVGYDILKTVEFSLPVAQIVLQHHERLDGSGYPKGLKEKDILLESKILAVSDVVEAMSSHRPYRPAHGTDMALEEISKNKGILYDSKVVDTCCEVFNKKGFTFE